MGMTEFEKFVEASHGSQVDKAGNPYFGHCLRVRDYASGILASLPEGIVDAVEAEEILRAALAHDVVEDTSVTKEHLLGSGEAPRMVSMVEAVSNNGWTGTYAGKIAKIVSDGPFGAIVVKLADNMDNRDASRLALMPPEKAERLAAKYAAARIVLEAGLEDAVARRLEESVAPTF